MAHIIELEGYTEAPGQGHRHISWSQYRIWKECQHRHWLLYHEGIKKIEPTKWTDFGSSIHYTAEDYYKLILENKTPNFSLESKFENYFSDLLIKNHKDYKESQKIKSQEVDEMIFSGKECISELIEFIDTEDELKGYKPYKVEYEINDQISENEEIKDWKFKGFVDLILKKENEEKYFLLDYKTCSWGWGKDKTTNPLTMGQIHAYKHFWKKNNPQINDLKDIKIGYILVKRTAKKTKRIQLLKTSAGEKTINKIIIDLEKMAKSFQKSSHFKNGVINSACDNCMFFATKHCPSN